jgi:putative ABC transport system permease protein
MRLAISAGGVSFAVLLIVLVLALYRGIYDEAGALASDAPSDLWVTQAGAADPAHGASILPASAVEALGRVPGVAAVQPLFGRTMEVGMEGQTGSFGFVLAIPEGPLQARVGESFGVRRLPEQGEIVLSGAAARAAGADVGDEVSIGAFSLDVIDVLDLTGAAFSDTVVVSAADAETAFGASESYSFALVTVAGGAAVGDVESAIERGVPGTNALTREAFADTTRREVEDGFLPIVGVLIGVAFVVGLAVIALTMYTSTVERVRDYGVLKAVGAAPGQLFAVVFRQSLVIALMGFVFGAAAGVVTGNLLEGSVPEFTTLYRWQDALAVLTAALLMSAVAAAVPIRRVAGIDPAMAFRA